MTKGRGAGKTPSKVVELINKAASEKSLRSISKATGLGLAALSRYSKGVGEPTQATLIKLADYFEKTVYELMDDSDMPKTLELIQNFRRALKEQKVEQLSDDKRKYGSLAEEFLKRLPQDINEISSALRILEDEADKLIFKLEMECVKCQKTLKS